MSRPLNQPNPPPIELSDIGNISATSTASSATIERLTGLTDRRLRQLAKDGWFPPPNRGVYELSATITGLLHYYRQSRTDVGAHRAAKLHEEHRKLRIGNDAKERKLVSRDAVLATFTAFARDARALLDQKLQNEYPAAVAGLDVAQARVFGKNLNDAICAAIRQLIEQWRI